MIRIVKYKTKFITETYTVIENPLPGTRANLLLLKQQYRMLDDTPFFLGKSNKHKERYDQMMFNTEFLEEMLAKHGELHCEYCNKQNLVIIHWRETPKPSVMATADHFQSKRDFPELARDKTNLRVACCKCNNKKAAENWECKFPYPEHKL